MLAKANRITSADDYRRVVRRGAKVAGAHTVSYLRSRESGTDARFGVIVSKKVGTAVRRNLVRRRIKAAGHEAVVNGAHGFDLVVRALPSAAVADFSTLRDEVRRAADRGANLSGQPGRSAHSNGRTSARADGSVPATAREEATGA